MKKTKKVTFKRVFLGIILLAIILAMVFGSKCDFRKNVADKVEVVEPAVEEKVAQPVEVIAETVEVVEQPAIVEDETTNE